MSQDSAAFQSTKDDDITIHQEKRFKGPKGTNCLGTHTEVKYLGIILDKGLTWKTQLKNMMNKAYKALDLYRHIW